MIDFVVNGAWGTRTESVQQVSERWAETFAALAEIDGNWFSGWGREAGRRSLPLELVPVSETDLTEFIERENRDPDAPYIGYNASLRTRNHGLPLSVQVAIHAGGESVWVTNVIVLSFSSRVIGEDSVPVLGRAHDILRVFAELWDIDDGRVYRRSEYKAVEEEFNLGNTDPHCGRAVYLSANRAALAPEGLPGTYTRTAHGGLIIDLTHGGTQDPGIETILDVNRKLRAAGALESLATPYERDKW